MNYYKIFNFHLCVLIGGILPFPFGVVLIPWLYWISFGGGRKNKELSEQACRALNFQFLIQCITFLSGIIMCTQSIKAMANGSAFNYTWVTYQLFLLVPICIIYPLFILVYMSITKKYKHFYPKTIRLFK